MGMLVWVDGSVCSRVKAMMGHIWVPLSSLDFYSIFKLIVSVSCLELHCHCSHSVAVGSSRQLFSSKNALGLHISLKGNDISGLCLLCVSCCPPSAKKKNPTKTVITCLSKAWKREKIAMVSFLTAFSKGYGWQSELYSCPVVITQCITLEILGQCWLALVRLRVNEYCIVVTEQIREPDSNVPPL